MDVVLVGPVLPQVENHSLAALDRALAEAGRSSAVVPFFGFEDLGRAADEVLGHGAPLCGISIQSTEAALASLSLAWLLRQRGFRGHLVCGGHFATLNAEEILRSEAGVDSVVRFAGEEALLGLAAGAELAHLPGILWREGDGIHWGAPGRVVGSGRPPRRGPLSRHLGFGAADLVSSHGCRERCAYCCVAAVTALEAGELARAGAAADPVWSRPAEALAEEIAALHRQGARVFNFMDDNLLPLEPDEACDWLAQLGQALARGGVGRIAFSLQLRADVVTPAVADALVALGLVRAYVGIDGTSTGQLRALGRRGPAPAGARALELLQARGVFAVCNALLLGPTFGFERIRGEIEGLAGLRGGPLHLLPLDVRAGTALDRRARARGLMEGSFLYRRYRFEDRRTELMARALLAFPTRLEERSVPIGLYDLGYNLGVARRLIPALAPLVERLGAEYDQIAAAWNADQLRLLRRAAEVAATGDEVGIERLIAAERPAVRAHDQALLARCDRALAELERAAREALGRPAEAHARGRLISLALSLGLAACGGGGARPGVDAADGPSPFGFKLSDAGLSEPRPVYDATVPSDAGCAQYEPRSLIAGKGSIPPAPPPTTCADGTQSRDHAPLLACVTPGCHPPATLVFDANGMLQSVESLSPELVACLQALLGKSCYPSLACSRTELTTHCWIA